MDEKLLVAFRENTESITKIEAEVEEIVSKAVAKQQAKLAELRTQDKTIRDAIKQSMQDTGTKKFENEYLSITYIAPTTRQTFDVATFKEEYPESYQKFLKTSEVSSSIRFKIKEDK